MLFLPCSGIHSIFYERGILVLITEECGINHLTHIKLLSDPVVVISDFDFVIIFVSDVCVSVVLCCFNYFICWSFHVPIQFLFSYFKHVNNMSRTLKNRFFFFASIFN